MRVTKANLEQYIKAVVLARLEESKKQMKALKEGIEYVIPIKICKMCSWKTLEIRGTGSKSLDLEKLKSITVYEVSSPVCNTPYRTAKRPMSTSRSSGRSCRAGPTRSAPST